MMIQQVNRAAIWVVRFLGKGEEKGKEEEVTSYCLKVTS